MKERFDFLGIKFHNLTLPEALQRVEDFIERRAPRMIFTPTAELIVEAQREKGLREIYNKADLLTIDSFVVYYAARLCGCPVKEPVSAVRLMFSFLKIAYNKKYKVYLLGAKEKIISRVVDILSKEYSGIDIVGWRNGYFDFENDREVVCDIIDKKPDILFVAMSSPLKERFISRNFEKMQVPVSIGVGGSFDIIAGECHLAPEWISRIGIEWFYRLIQEPGRLWKRYLMTNTKFVLLLLKEYLYGGEK